MNMQIPIVGADPQTQWGTDLNACLTVIDAHTHAPGSGALINTSGISINADLSMNNFSLTTIKTLTLNVQANHPTGTTLAYSKAVSGNNELFFTDSANNHVQLTNGGSIAGAAGNITGLGGGAAVTYVNGTTKYVFTDNSTRPAALDGGAVLIRQTDAVTPNAVTLQSPNALGANYSLTLPTAAPVSTQYIASDSSGNLSFSTADAIGSAMTTTGANAIVNTANTSASVWTPTVTTAAGSLSGVVKSCAYYKIGSLVMAVFSVTFTQNTSVSAHIDLTLPVTSAGNTAGSDTSSNQVIGGGVMSVGVNNGVTQIICAGVYSVDRTIARVFPMLATSRDNWNVGAGIAQGILIYTAN